MAVTVDNKGQNVPLGKVKATPAQNLLYQVVKFFL